MNGMETRQKGWKDSSCFTDTQGIMRLVCAMQPARTRLVIGW